MDFKVKYFEMKIADDGDIINKPDLVLQAIKGEFNYNEKMIVLGMNIKNKILIKKEVAIGGYNTLMIKPADIFIPLLKTNARNFIIVHNHPSDTVEPSQEDIIFTKKLEKACEYVGLNFLDHVIVSNGDYYSFKKNGIL